MDFPLSGEFPGMTYLGSYDGVVVKYNLDGTQAAIATFATTSDDTGVTSGVSSGSSAGRSDVFFARLDSSLNQQWLIQTGTSSSEGGYALAIDSAGNVVVGGWTSGTWPEQTNAGSADAYIMKYEVNDTGGTRQWVIQFGSTGNDLLYGLTVDTVGSADDIYATGETKGEFEGNTYQGGNDMYLIKVGDGQGLKSLKFPLKGRKKDPKHEEFVLRKNVLPNFRNSKFSTLKVSSTGTIVWSRVDGVPSSQMTTEAPPCRWTRLRMSMSLAILKAS